MSYVTRQSVQREAGLWFRELGETPAGSANGSNRVFTVVRKPLADNDYDDEVTPADVTLYVNGATVAVVSVDVTAGTITAVTAPANGAAITVDYSYSPVAADLVDQVIEEAEEYVNNHLAHVTTVPFEDEEDVPKTVRKITRFYAAGLLMSPEYGFQASDDSRKEGEGKIQQAEKWMAEYKDLTIDNNADTNAISVPRSSSARRLFQRFDSDAGGFVPLRDENFTVNEAD